MKTRMMNLVTSMALKKCRERIGAVKNEFISDNVEELTEKLMRYKLKKHSSDKRTIFTCEFKKIETLKSHRANV